jgi:hypothetical protein
MVDLPRGKFLGTQTDPITGKRIDAKEVESFVKCPTCGGMVDCRDLAVVLAHLKPPPHPGQDATN